MSRESCVTHRPKQAMAIVRQDYYELTGKDACAAALLNIFEYWANAAIATDPAIERPWVGARPIREFELLLLGIATDKQIRKRLVRLEESGFIQSEAPAHRCAAKEYQVCVPEIQQALFGQITEQEKSLRSNDQASFGQMTEQAVSVRSNDQTTFGQITEPPSVKQPNVLRSNDRTLKKISKESKESKEEEKESSFDSIDLEGRASERAKPEQREVRSPVQVGTVRYSQSPETIDFSEQWATNPGMVKAQLRFIAPGHKRLDMVAHGFGQWWVGPRLNDFDEFLIKACQNRKRKLQQADSIGDAKTFINNMIKSGDWANFALRCDEAQELRDRASTTKERQPSVVAALPENALSRVKAEQREAAIGLLRFKVTQGNLSEARKIADSQGITYAEIGLSEDGQLLTQAA